MKHCNRNAQWDNKNRIPKAKQSTKKVGNKYAMQYRPFIWESIMKNLLTIEKKCGSRRNVFLQKDIQNNYGWTAQEKKNLKENRNEKKIIGKMHLTCLGPVMRREDFDNLTLTKHIEGKKDKRRQSYTQDKPEYIAKRGGRIGKESNVVKCFKNKRLWGAMITHVLKGHGIQKTFPYHCLIIMLQTETPRVKTASRIYKGFLNIHFFILHFQLETNQNFYFLEK